MEPHQKVHHLFFNLLRILFKAIGFDIFRSGEFKPYLFTYVIYCLYASFFVGVTNTLLQYDLTTALNIIGLIGIAFEVNDALCDLIRK